MDQVISLNLKRKKNLIKDPNTCKNINVSVGVHLKHVCFLDV